MFPVPKYTLRVTKPLSANLKRKATNTSSLQNPFNFNSLKKKKLSTTEKTSLDWEIFKEKEGIQQDLNQATKNGFEKATKKSP